MRLRVHIGQSAVNYTFVDLIPHTNAELRPAFAYCEAGKRIAISSAEYRAIRRHPYRYYFSTALKLHLRCLREGIAEQP
jgi:hypothetical protein